MGYRDSSARASCQALGCQALGSPSNCLLRDYSYWGHTTKNYKPPNIAARHVIAMRAARKAAPRGGNRLFRLPPAARISAGQQEQERKNCQLGRSRIPTTLAPCGECVPPAAWRASATWIFPLPGLCHDHTLPRSLSGPARGFHPVSGSGDRRRTNLPSLGQ